MNTCNFFGIYPDEIERASDICTETLEHMGLSNNEIDELYDNMHEEFYSFCGTTNSNITNELILSMFTVVKEYILERYADLDIDVYVNGYDSDIIINGEYAQNYDFGS